MQPDIRPLNAEEADALRQGLEFAASLVGEKGKLAIWHVQSLYDRLLEGTSNAEAEICAGLAFGELVRAAGGFEWVRVTDEVGAETCVGAPGGPDAAGPGGYTYCAPISMIRKRVARREEAMLSQLVASTVKTMRDQIGAAQRPEGWNDPKQ